MLCVNNPRLKSPNISHYRVCYMFGSVNSTFSLNPYRKDVVYE